MAVPVILLVDDTRLFLALEKEFLKQSAVRVITASNGREALEVAEKTRPDLVFLDLNMPEMNGVECCRRFKSHPALSTVPVIMVTTAAEESEVCRKAGCDDFLMKPLDRRLFLETGRKYLGCIDRRDRRVPFRTKVLIRVNGTDLTGSSEDLSPRGLFIACSDPAVRLEDKVEISFPVSGTGDDIVEAWGRVAWVNDGVPRRPKSLLPHGFGLEFLAMTERSEILIRERLQQLAKG